MGTPGDTTVVTTRALNRALLARQSLLARSHGNAVNMVGHLVGMQSQTPLAPYTGLWSRLRGFDPGELAAALVDRTVVRLAVMRGTVHLVTAADALVLRPLTQSIFDRNLRTSSTYRGDLAELDLADVAVRARAIVEASPCPPIEVGRRLLEHFPTSTAEALAHAARGLLPLVQVPPRGVWGRGGQVRVTTAETWLGRPLAAKAGNDNDHAALDDVVLRYLGAFGPASAADVAQWSGLTGLAEVLEGLRPRLMTVRTEGGRELFDLPDAPRPDPDTPAPVRFLPEFDNVLLSHADRTRVVADRHRSHALDRLNVILGSVLVDGFAVANWKLTKTKEAVRLTVEPFDPFASRDRTDVEEEAVALLAFTAPDSDHRVIMLGT